MPSVVNEAILEFERSQLGLRAKSQPASTSFLPAPNSRSLVNNAILELERSTSITSPRAYAAFRQAKTDIGLLEKAGVSGMNTIVKLLDILNTPQQLIFGATIGVVKGEDILEAAIRGARENVTGSDLLEALGVGELGTYTLPLFGEVTGRGIIGLSLDIGIDIPIFGAISKSAKLARLPALAKKTGRGIRAAGLAARQSSKRVDAALGQWRMFATDNERVLMDIALEGTRRAKGKGGLAKKTVEQFAEKVEKVAKKKGVALPQFTRTLRDLIERKTRVQGSLSINPKDFSFDAAKLKRKSPLPPDELTAKEALKAITGKQANLDLLAEDVVTISTTRRSLARVERGEVKAGLRKQLDETEVSREMAELVQEAKQLLNDGILQEINHGLGTLSLDDAWVDYLPHLLTASARKILSNRIPDLRGATRSAVFSGKHSSQLLRKWKGYTISELDEFGKRGILPGLEGTKIQKLFIDDPSTAIAARLVRGEKAISDAEVFFKSAKQLGKTKEELLAVGANVDDWRKLKIVSTQDDRLKPLASYLDSFHFEDDVAKHLDAYYKVITEPRAFSEFLETFDNIQGIWKASTLFIFPGYHARNMVGNWWNNFLAGINPMFYKTAIDWQSGAINKINLGGLTIARREMDEIFERYGVVNQFREFLAIPEVRIGEKLSTAGTLGKVPVLGRGTEFGIKIGNNIENNARIAHFFDRVNKGDNFRDAALSVKKYLFNYDELSGFEQKVMRRFFPFYAWTRNNLPLQIRSIVEKPAKFAFLGDVINFVEEQKTPPRGEGVIVQDWMRRMTPIRTRIDEDGDPEYFLLGGWLPSADLNKLAEPWKILEDELSPFVKAPFELGSGFSLFLDRKIEDFPGQKEKFIGLNIRKKATALFRNIRILTTIDTILASTEGAIRDGETGILTDRRAKPIADTALQILLGINVRSVNRRQGLRSAKFAMRELKSQLRREKKRGRDANVEKLKEELVNLKGLIRR